MQTSQDPSSNPSNYKREQYFRKCFTPDEDARLLLLINKYRYNWKKISNDMKNRSVRQCKERFHHYLSPNIKHDNWTQEEDILLLKTVDSFGKRWKIFELIFKGRTEISIRNRYNVLIRKINKNSKIEKILNEPRKESSNVHTITNNSKIAEKLDIKSNQTKKELTDKNEKEQQHNIFDILDDEFDYLSDFSYNIFDD